ncbi:MAG: ATP-binding protein [Pseudomonadota bacterium]
MGNTSKYIQIFMTDSRKELEEMNRILQSLEKSSNNPNLINDLFRKAHSLKGMAATMGFARLAELSHALEEPLNKIRDGQAALTKDTIGLLFEGVGLLEGLVQEAINDSHPHIDYQNFISRLQDKTHPAGPLASPAKSLITYQPPKFISVETQTLDSLINVVGEMIIHRSRLTELSRPLSSYELDEEMQSLENLIRELYNQVIKLRMMPVAPVTDFLYRTVRELAQSQGKDIALHIEGDKEIRLDRTIIEGLMDPLIHLIRNAIDHGIEPPTLRREKGKPRGAIWVRFAKERDMVRVEVEDNGQGIEVVKVKDLAVKKGIMKKELSELTRDEDALMLLCTPGFTTSQQVTDISGRGVGLDVVKDRVETLGGSLHIHSTPEVGSTFILKIPATTHIIYALLIKLNAQVFALPIPHVLATTKINLKGAQHSFIFQNEEVSLVPTKELLKMGEPSKGVRAYSPVAVVEIRGRKSGLMVDEILGIEQIFVKPLGKPLNKIEGLFGVTTLGDGRMVLVLDLERLR